MGRRACMPLELQNLQGSETRLMARTPRALRLHMSLTTMIGSCQFWAKIHMACLDRFGIVTIPADGSAAYTWH